MEDQANQNIPQTKVIPVTREDWFHVKWWTMGFTFLLVVLTLFPIYNIIHILATTGANNLSNDYALFIPLIEKILSGDYAWKNFFQDTFFVSHFQPLPILVYLVNAIATRWNVYYELFFIVLLSTIRLFLTYQVLSSLVSNRFRYLLLPILSLLIFSNSQISSYEFGASAVPLGLTAFGFTLGAWGLVKFGKRSISLLFIVLGGLFASWTAASGIIAWLIFLAAMVLLGYRKARHYIAWLISALVINFPYIYFLLLHQQSGTNASLQSIFDLRLIVNLLGRPFANGIGSTTSFLVLGEAAGWLGLLLGGLGVGFVLINHRRLLQMATPPLMFMAFGIICAWQTSLFRVMIGPWYTNMVMPYWVGLVGLALLLITTQRELVATDWIPNITSRRFQTVYPIAILIFITGFYLGTNLTYRDKSFYMVSRSPAYAACVRNYEWAPTYCESSLSPVTPNRFYMSNFAWLLQRHQLSVFALHQQWSMQGDEVLGTVSSLEAPNTPGAEWYDGLPGSPASYKDYRHLNLLITPSHSSVWTVKLPENLTSAELFSAVGVGKGTKGSVTFEIYISTNGQPEVLLFSQVISNPWAGWSGFQVSLLAYRGKEVSLHYTVRGDSSLVALYRFPSIELTVQYKAPLTTRPEITPINTDLSADAPLPTPSDYVFNLQEMEQHGLFVQSGSPSTWKVETSPNFYTSLATPLNLHDYGWVSFRLSVTADITSRTAVVLLFIEGQAEPVELVIPLLPDEGSHTYTYPFRMVEINGKLTGMSFYPVLIPSASGRNLVTVEDLRLIQLP